MSRTCQAGEQALRGSGLGNLDLRGVAVKVARDGIGACGERERRCKRLGLHVVGVRRERVPEVGIDLGGDGDALRDLEVSLLAHRLHVADELARQALGDERGGERRFEPHHDGAFGGDDHAGLRPARDKHVLVRQLEALHGRGAVERLQRGDAGGDGLHLRSALPAERLEVRLVAHVAKRGFVGDVGDLLDVELVEDEVVEPRVGAGDEDLRERLAHLEVVVHAQLAAELDDGLHGGHLAFEGEVTRAGAGRREVTEVDALGIVLALQVAVDRLGDERRERRRDLRELHEYVAERAVGVELVPVVLALPEAAAAAADVPVRQVLDERDERAHRALEVILVHRGRDVGDQRLHRAADPAVEDVRRIGHHDRLVVEAVHVRVGDEEGVGVPPRDEQVAEDLLDAVLGELQVLGAHDGRVDHVEADRVRAVRVEHERRVGVVLQALRHLLAVLGEDEAVDDDVPVRALPEEHRAEEHERVEPAARLVKALGDEVGREEGRNGRGLWRPRTPPKVTGYAGGSHVVLLRIGHGPAFKPAVEHFGRAVVGLAVLPDDDLVDEVLVEVGDAHAAQVFEFLDGPDADHVVRIVVVDPHGDAASPEAVAGNVPVARVLEPVAEALVAHVGGRPVDAVVVRDELVVQVLHLHVPGVDRAVDERCVGTVAERVGVGDRRLVDEPALGLQALDDVLVAVLAEAARVLGHLVGEVAARVEGVDERVHPRLLADAEVVLAVGGGDVDEARAVVGRDVAVVQDAERALGLSVRKIRENRLVGSPLQRGALEGGDALVLLGLPEDVRQAGLRHHVDGARVVREVAHRHVVDVRARADHQVLGERPGRRRPDEEVDRRLLREQVLERIARALDLHAHGDGRILHVLVVRTCLEVRERRRKLPGIRHDAVRAVDAALVPKLLEDPPDRLHEVGVHGLVVVVEVDPAAHARDGLAPLRDVLQHHRTALLVELVHAEGLDLGRPRDAERVLRERLDGEAVRVPAEAALHVLAAHGLVARHDVLDGAGEKVAVVRQPRRERRPVVERIAVLAPITVEGLPEHIGLGPILEHVLLHPRELDLVRYRLEHLALLQSIYKKRRVV